MPRLLADYGGQTQMTEGFPWGWPDTATPYDELYGLSDAEEEGGDSDEIRYLSGLDQFSPWDDD